MKRNQQKRERSESEEGGEECLVPGNDHGYGQMEMNN